MLNQTGVTKESYASRKTILVDEMNSTAFSVVVSNDGVAAVNGKKIIKAGTPVSGNLQARGTAFKVAKTDSTTDAVGIILHDVDVTAGNANSQVVVFGFVDVNKLDSTVQAMITADVMKVLNMIKFVK